MEVAEIVAMDARKEPRFNPENRFFDPKEILVICSSLVSVYTDKALTSKGWGSWPCVKLAHFSVKEYLTSGDIHKGPASMYAISREIANTSIAESCLALLLHFDKPDSLTYQLEEDFSGDSDRKESLIPRFEREFPLAQYAAEHGVKHACHTSWVGNSTEGLVSELFFKRDTLENWIRLHDPDWLWYQEPALSRPSTDIVSPIYYASAGGFLKPLEKLIETGADVNAPGGTYGNALQVASYNGHQEVISLLLDKGADVNAPGGKYSSALQAASYTGYQQIVQILLNAGADVNAQGGYYGNALQAASFWGHQQIVEILLDAGADVNAQGGRYGNALQAASYEGHQQIVQILLNAGADVNTQGGRYGNVLQAASSRGHKQIVQILLDAAADVNAQGGNYGNALQGALYHRHQDIAQILRNHGAHEDVKSLENDEYNMEIDGLQSDSHGILPAAAPQATQ